MSESVKDIFKVLRSKGIVKWLQIKGCSEKEIVKLESELDIELPAKYREFLKYCGKSAGEFSIGTDMLYYDVFDLREVALDVLKNNRSSFKLPQTAFVFMVQQGYQFMYFDLSLKSDDPKVFCFIEEEMKKPEKAYNSFSDFLKAFTEDLVKLKEENSG